VEPLPTLRTRAGEVDENYGNYMTVEQLQAKIAEKKARERGEDPTSGKKRHFKKRKP
jgi:hypothetical protein